MRGWLVGCAVDAAWFIQELVQLRWAVLASLKGLPFVAATLVAETGVNRGLLGVAAASSITALVIPVTPRLPVPIAYFGGAGVATMVALPS